MGDDVDAAGPAQPRGGDEGVDLGGDGVEVVAGRGLVAVAEPARVEDHDAPPARSEQRRDLAPGVAVLRPAGEQEHGVAASRIGIMEPDAADAQAMLLQARRDGPCGRGG